MPVTSSGSLAPLNYCKVVGSSPRKEEDLSLPAAPNPHLSRGASNGKKMHLPPLLACLISHENRVAAVWNAARNLVANAPQLAGDASHRC